MSANLPPGTIISYVGESPDSVANNWLYCDGTSYAQLQYPGLFAAIGTAFGSQGDDYFNVPDMRGMFLRGVSDQSGVDPDAAYRLPQTSGGNSGDQVGTVQDSAVENHNHQLGQQSGFKSSGDYGVYLANLGGGYTDVQGNVGDFSSETRPINIYVYYLIYTGDLS